MPKRYLLSDGVSQAEIVQLVPIGPRALAFAVAVRKLWPGAQLVAVRQPTSRQRPEQLAMALNLALDA